MEGLTSQFGGLKIAKTAIYNFTVNECALTTKKAYFEPKQRNSPASVKASFNWAANLMNTDINCILIYESAFHINLSRTMAWSTKGTRAAAIQPKMRARTWTILGAISLQSVIIVKMRVPYEQSSKKRKITSESKEKRTAGTVLGHCFNFISDTLDVHDWHEQFSGHCLITDNASIHPLDQIEKLIVNRGYGCVYLPPYPPELNLIEQFWSVVKSKVEREKLLKEEALPLRIVDACNSVYLEDLWGSCRYSNSKLQVCSNKEPL